MITTGMPPLPVTVPMAFELGAYGAAFGLLFLILRPIRSEFLRLYVALLGAMIAGRVVYGIISWTIIMFQGKTYTFQAYLTAVVLQTYPGIIIQLILVPALLFLLPDLILRSDRK
jgi:hypothetical protein